jgi:diguanylate cyclase (GGDEF)-like protein
MHRLFDRYHQISFRGRLLCLLVAVSLVQAGVAAYTFFDLQAKPAEQRVQAQLNAALRGMAPVIDARLAEATERLEELSTDPALGSAIEAEDWTTAGELIGLDSSSLDGDVAAGFEPVDVDAETADAVKVPSAYVTDSRGEVVAGSIPEGALINQPGSTSTRMMRGAQLLATVHVPVAVDATFLEERVGGYVPKGVDVFVADEESLMSSGAKAGPEPRPEGLREGLRDITVGGTKQFALVQPLLDGRVLVGASIPSDVVAKQKREGVSSLWGFIGLMALLTVLVSWFITRAVGDALRKFADIARDLAGGQLSRRIPVTGDDEIAVLSTSFNDMAENLEERIESLVAARASMRRQVDLFGEALANATETSEMLQAVCSLAMESTHASHARFWTVDDDGHYEHAACIGLRPNDTEPCGLEKAVPVRNGSVRSDGNPHWLVVPARMRDGQIVGLLTLVSTGDDFAADDVRIAERIAVQAAVALDNARMHEQLRLQATRDGLTGLPNHRSLQDELTRRIAEAGTTQMPLGVALLDIDNFKRVNDTYGHQVGDEAIKALGRTLAHGIGGMGMVGRYGGEEFVVIMPGCDAETSMRIADRLREDITFIEVPLEDGEVLKITASFGVANVDQQREVVAGTDLLHQADVGLYNAKRSGKNRVNLAGPDTEVMEMSDAEKAKLAAREAGDLAAEQAAADAQNAAAPYDPFDLAA